MNEWTAKSARLGSRAGHQFTATRTPSQFSETPRSGRIRTGEKGELVHGEVFKSSRANPGSFACQQLAPLAFRTERYTHTQPLALAEVVISWDKQAVPQRKYNFCDLQVCVGGGGWENSPRSHPQFPSSQYPEAVCWKSSPVPTVSLGGLDSSTAVLGHWLPPLRA